MYKRQDMEPTDVSFRCNLVTLSEEESVYEDRRILDHSAGEISTEEAAVLIEAVRQEDVYKRQDQQREKDRRGQPLLFFCVL